MNKKYGYYIFMLFSKLYFQFQSINYCVLQESHSEQQYKNKHNNSGNEFKGEQTEISFIKFRNRKFGLCLVYLKKKN